MADAPALDHDTIERSEALGGPILIALSGGGDSTALLHLMAARFGAKRLLAVVVDHALRDGSADDAARAGGCARGLGVAVKIVHLAWPRGPRRAQADTREARYRALAEAARAAGAKVIALGHTRDDQAETVLLRAARGSAWRGLAGMRAFSPAPIWPEGRGLWLARPLLHARREALREFLRGKGAAWIEDPANSNRNYARVRVRERLAALAQSGLDPMRLAALAESLAPRATALDRAAASLIQEAARFDDDRVLIALEPWRGDNAVREHALGALIAAAGGAARAPDAEAVAALARDTEARDFKAATLGGALIRRSRDGLTLTRDPGALKGRADGAPAPAPMQLPAGQEAIWDGRLALTLAEPDWAVYTENGAPVLAQGETRAAIAAAQPRWLLAERAAHWLGV